MMPTHPTANPRRPLPLPTPSLVVQLQTAPDEPAVSLLANTTPADTMEADDRERLRRLAREAIRRLDEEEVAQEGRQRIAARLDRELERVTRAPSDLAVAVYSGPHTAMSLRLPLPVVERAVVDPSFATRDLVRVLHRTPRHAVLVVDWDEARLYSGQADQLDYVRNRRFPLSRSTYGTDVEAFLRDVDRAFGTYLLAHPSPVVVAGRAGLMDRYVEISRNLTRLAGVLTLDPATTSRRQLTTLVRPMLESYLLSRQDEALELVASSRAQGLLASGMAEAWRAVHRDQPHMLAVEQGLFYPARLLAGGHSLEAADDVDHPEVIDDAVDELIETVLVRGGWVALVDDGRLARDGGVALALRNPR